jgi:TolA-binding protein
MSKIGQGDTALRDWTELLTKHPTSDMVAETLYQKAIEELRLKNHRAASTTLDELLRRFPEDKRKAEILYWRASIFRQLDEIAEAEKMYLAALAATPSKEFEREIMLELGTILLNAGRKADAANYFRQLLDAPIAEKIGVDRLAWLAEFDCSQKQYDNAIRAANVLLALPAADKGWKQTAWTLIGRARRTKNERDPAMQAFTEALATGASTVYGTEAALSLGELLTDAGKYDDAATRLNEAALRAAPQDQLRWRAMAYSGLARNAELKGDAEGALRYYMSVSILFNDPALVPESMVKAIALLDKLERTAEANAMRDELKARYPNAAGGGATP